MKRIGYFYSLLDGMLVYLRDTASIKFADWTRTRTARSRQDLKKHVKFGCVSLLIGGFLDRLKASEGEDTVVNSVGDVLEQQVSKQI